MANLAQMMKELRTARNNTAKELERLDKAIGAVGKLISSDSGSARQAKKPRTRRRLSAAARKRIADAQKARWAKVRKQQKAA